LRQNDFKIRLDEIEKHYDKEIHLLIVRIEVESASIVAQIKAEKQERKIDRRWMIGTTLTAAGLIIAVIKLF